MSGKKGVMSLKSGQSQSRIEERKLICWQGEYENWVSNDRMTGNTFMHYTLHVPNRKMTWEEEKQHDSRRRRIVEDEGPGN